MNRWKPSVLHEGEGNIRNIKWRGHLIAWANNMVSIFHLHYVYKNISVLHWLLKFFSMLIARIFSLKTEFVEMCIKGIEG